jgi:hypothetical protein
VAIQPSLVAKFRLPGGGALWCQLVLYGLLSAPLAWSATPELPPAVSSIPPAVKQDGSAPEVVVEANEPKYVAPTLRDRIGRIWAPVLINGKGPFRLVLDTGASHSAIISRVADALGVSAQTDLGCACC